MDNTLFSKCEVISDLYNDFYGTPEWESFFARHDLAIFSAVSHVAGNTILTELGATDIAKAYSDLCHVLGISEDEFYSSLDEMRE